MCPAASEFAGRVSFITGPEKGSGKTTFLRYVLGLLRAEGLRPAVMTLGLEGDRGRSDPAASAGSGPPSRSAAPGARSGPGRSQFACLPGEIFLSSERLLRSSTCLPEILDLLPGSSALGRIVIARARRSGRVVLVGPEHNEHLAWAIERIRGEGWADTILVDGALNRITLAAAVPGARFHFVLRVARGELDRALGTLRRLHRLLGLPLLDGGPPAPPAAPPAAHTATPGVVPYELDGPLTAETLARIPTEARTIVVEDFTKVFLDAASLSALLRNRFLVLRRGVEFGGFVVILRDLVREEFLDALADSDLARQISFNPYEVAHV